MVKFFNKEFVNLSKIFSRKYIKSRINLNVGIFVLNKNAVRKKLYVNTSKYFFNIIFKKARG